MDASAGQPAYIPPQKLREALQRLVNALISAIAAARDRRLAAATYDVRAELAEMQDIDDWCPQDDIGEALLIASGKRPNDYRADSE